MKKLLNISVIAALAILPLAANAATGDIITVTDPATAASAEQAANAVTSGTSPKYALAVEAANDDKVATASYVKGAYNAAIKAINKVSETADSAVKGVQVNGADLTLTNGKANVTVAEGSTNGTVAVNGADVAVHGLGSAAYTDSTAYISSTAGSVHTANIADGDVTKAKLASGVQTSLDKADASVQGVKVNGTALTEDANGAVNVTIAEGATNGTVAVNGADVAVHGLGSAAYTSSDAYDTAGAASTAKGDVETKLTAGSTGYDINAKTLKVQGADVLTGASLTDYAKKTGVTNTISASSISGTVQTVATWGSTTTSTTPIAATITGATYTETAPQQGGGN